jgi:hypothetical protein
LLPDTHLLTPLAALMTMLGLPLTGLQRLLAVLSCEVLGLTLQLL